MIVRRDFASTHTATVLENFIICLSEKVYSSWRASIGTVFPSKKVLDFEPQ